MYHVVGDVENLGVGGQRVRQLRQVHLGAVDLHPQRVVDVDDVAAAVYGAARRHILRSDFELEFAPYIRTCKCWPQRSEF
jgi:hypothetical protein